MKMVYPRCVNVSLAQNLTTLQQQTVPACCLRIRQGKYDTALAGFNGAGYICEKFQRSEINFLPE
jgi:hypothetical protein